MNNIKLIALDIDGVLNSRNWAMSRKAKSQRFFDIDPKTIDRVNRITRSTSEEDCPTKIVLSSTWRLDFPMGDGQTSMAINMFFEAIGIEPVALGRTGYFQVHRGREILIWIAQSQIIKDIKVKNLVILDDDGDMDPLKKYWVHCKNATGLTDVEVNLAIEMLNKPFKFNLRLGV